MTIVSHAFWRGRLAGDPRAIGSVVQLDGLPFEVIGVLPPDFAFPDGSVQLAGSGLKLLTSNQAHDGAPTVSPDGTTIAFASSRDVANTGQGGQRPNRIGDGRLEEPTVDKWFDTAAFTQAPRLVASVSPA